MLDKFFILNYESAIDWQRPPHMVADESKAKARAVWKEITTEDTEDTKIVNV